MKLQNRVFLQAFSLQNLHEISNAIAAYNESYGYGVIRDLVGHGIGTELHEDPQIPNFTQERRGIKLYEGMTLAIEPMVAAGGYAVKWLDDDSSDCRSFFSGPL